MTRAISLLRPFVSCPDRTAPAEIIERFSLASTDGPVDHIVLFCAGGHHFRPGREGRAECRRASAVRFGA